jgi:hypothetical protein
MKIYPKLNVELRFQNCGSWWLMILEGAEADIELCFNGLWNHGAIDVSVERADGSTYNGLDYTDNTRTKAKFWSTPEKMRKFFFNSHLLACQQESCAPYAHVVANMRIEELKRDMITFVDFTRPQFVNSFDVGTVRAERPDDNYREAALTHSFRMSGEKTVDKE